MQTYKKIIIGGASGLVLGTGAVALTPTAEKPPVVQEQFLTTPEGEELTREEIQAELAAIDGQIEILIAQERTQDAESLMARKAMLETLIQP